MKYKMHVRDQDHDSEQQTTTPHDSLMVKTFHDTSKTEELLLILQSSRDCGELTSTLGQLNYWCQIELPWKQAFHDRHWHQQLIDCIIHVIQNFSYDADILYSSLMVFTHILKDAGHLFDHVTSKELVSKWLQVIFKILSQHKSHLEIQANGWRAVSRLLEYAPENSFHDEVKPELQHPILALCLDAISLYEENEEVFISACKSLYHLTAKNDNFSKAVMKKSSHTAIMRGLSIHSLNPEAVQAVCRVIRHLNIFQYEHKLLISHCSHNFLSQLAKVMAHFSKNPDVVHEVIRTIAGLADIDFVRHQCYVVDIHLHVLTAMDNFTEDELLLEIALEALAVLGCAAGGSHILNSNGAFDRAIRCMSRFQKNNNIQVKGLYVIQVLTTNHLVLSQTMCCDLVSIIQSCLKNFPNSLIIQKETLVAILLLTKSELSGHNQNGDSTIARFLVEQDWHGPLFRILEKQDADQDLQDLASECLCVLALDQNLKSQMLLNACSRGCFDVAECLIEFGADVNIGQGTETPLYFAVSCGNESMVSLLLQRGVRDVQTSLTQSFANGCHNITGMLLFHIGQDRESGTIVWSDLELHDIRPEWIFTALHDQERAFLPSVISRRFVTMIKLSEEKRNLRLLQSTSDSSSEMLHQNCFRFPCDILKFQENNNQSLPEPSVFEFSLEELENWRRNTLSGANIPFNPADPRIKYPELANTKKSSAHDLPELNGMTNSVDVTKAIKNGSLETSANHTTDVDSSPVIKSFHQLYHLDLSSNELKNIHTEILKGLPSLKTLVLCNNKLTEFPASVEYCTQLTSLDLSSNLITLLSFDSVKSRALEKLNLSKNQLTIFPAGLGKAYPHLRHLDISSNKLQALPSKPCDLTDIRCLDVSHNSIQIFPDEFLRNSPKLETLIAVNNGLEVLSSESVAPYLPLLSTLKLSHNDITEKEPFYVPRFILELPNVRVVDLSHNGLVGLPSPSQWKSQILKELIVSKNIITKLNLDGACLWSKLEKLHLSSNNISELPKEVGQLSSLLSLDLSHNKNLTTLPDELGRCSHLWEMPLDGLSLDLNSGLTSGRVKDLISFLHNRLKKAKLYHRMKLMVVGYGGRGKTSLLQALRKKMKNPPSDKPPVTVGVIVDDWRYIQHMKGKNVRYTLSTWDFAGQEDFYSTHQCFLSNRTLYLVVCDVSLGTTEIDKLKPWLSNIHARAPGCPVIVVGTHLDLLPEDKRQDVVEGFHEKLLELTDKPGFPAIVCFMVVSLTGESRELKQLRKKIKETVNGYTIKGQPVMGQKVPASYVKLEDLLYEQSKKIDKSFPIIRHSQLVRLIKMANIDLDENEELNQAVNFLHESGVLLHFSETTLQMKDFYFINPGWLCRMMAQVVTVPEINPFIDVNGVMKRSAAHMLFMDKQKPEQSSFVFPSLLIPQYLHLLEKFEIALPRNEEELLIPCRLPNRKPDIKIPVQQQTELVCRHYVMPYTPIGFWSRLLTRLIVFSESTFVEKVLILREKPQVQFWKEGIFARWSQTAFFLVDSYQGSNDEVHMTVPATAHGIRLLGYLVDYTDSLVDEWYPGLITIDPMLGRGLLEKFIPCTMCNGPQPYKFRFEDLLKESENQTEIFCPKHQGMVSLVKLTPDLMLADMEPHFHLDQDQFDFKESPENLCGDGGFGTVYKAVYRKQVVAVKVFSALGDIHPLKMLRQEATILRRLKHPSIIALVGVSLRPVPLVVMEFAACKSLHSVFESGHHLGRTLQLKIAQQVSEGLAYLHSMMIVYRDMKPDNILVFSLTQDAMINVKIADYGISQFTTLFGLKSKEGTSGYKAPEVIRGETYTCQADIFSFGVLLYMVLTNGVHPFQGLQFNNEFDRAFAENWPIPPVSKCCPPWPDFHDVVTRCLSQSPDHRPKAQTLFNWFSSADFFSMREVLPVSIGTSVKCMATQVLDGSIIRVWAVSGGDKYMELSWFNLLDYTNDSSLCHDKTRKSADSAGMGTMFKEGQVLCILPISKEHILLGTQAGKIWVFNTTTNDLEHSTRQLQGSILSLCLVQRHEKDNLILAGLANGKIALYPMSEILQEPALNPMEMKLGEAHEPVQCILPCQQKNYLIASCGTKVVVMDARMGIAVKNRFNTVDESEKTAPAISSMAHGHHLYLTKQDSQLLEVWDITLYRKLSTINVGSSFKLSMNDASITSIVLQDVQTLWLGTVGGHILLLDVNTWAPIICTHRHTGPVRSLQNVRLRNTTTNYGAKSGTSVILSGGLGFKNRSESDVDNDNQFGCIQVWDADYSQTVKRFSDWSRKRKELCRAVQRL